jgi:hypothetical protein
MPGKISTKGNGCCGHSPRSQNVSQRDSEARLAQLR